MKLCSYFLWIICFFTQGIYALDLELTQGVNTALPIGIHSFGSDNAAHTITQVIDHDLRLSGQFKIIPDMVGVDSPSMGYWQRAGADSLLQGRVASLGSQRYEVSFQLLDPAAGGHQLLAKKYQVNERQLRALAHHISDEVYQKLTGERGVFSTRIAYVLVRRNSQQTQYSLEIADMDGVAPQSLLLSTEPIMSPTWSPDGRQLAYVSFEKKKSQIFTVDVATGSRRLLTDFTGINGAPSWSPDGRTLAVVLSKGGSPKIYLVDLGSGSMKQVTFGNAIDTEPRFSPDGKSLLFTSGRGGSPQIYRIQLANGQITRITYDGNYNARASFTPNQQQIVMLHRDDQQFHIGTQTLGNNTINVLTHSPMDESPSVAPNGRMILYATRYQDQGILAIVSLDGQMNTKLPIRDGDIQEPAWAPFLR
jgi:TolB protein